MFLGPVQGYTDGVAGCLPSDDVLEGGDAARAPSIGELEEELGLTWYLALETTAVISFLDWFSASTPRESYAATWVYSNTSREATLAVGHDDGARIWLNGVMVDEDETCHGTVTDNFAHPVTLEAGWNRLLIKVRDNGGGWGLVARFKDESNAPIDDLDISPSGPYAWIDDQQDSDGDGYGDACDRFALDPSLP
jgi:hypothetical protein